MFLCVHPLSVEDRWTTADEHIRGTLFLCFVSVQAAISPPHVLQVGINQLRITTIIHTGTMTKQHPRTRRQSPTTLCSTFVSFMLSSISSKDNFLSWNNIVSSLVVITGQYCFITEHITQWTILSLCLPYSQSFNPPSGCGAMTIKVIPHGDMIARSITGTIDICRSQRVFTSSSLSCPGWHSSVTRSDLTRTTSVRVLWSNRVYEHQKRRNPMQFRPTKSKPMSRPPQLNRRRCWSSCRHKEWRENRPSSSTTFDSAASVSGKKSCSLGSSGKELWAALSVYQYQRNISV